MAAELPYLPPIDRFQRDTQAIARGTAEDVAAQTSAAGKVGAVVRGGIATIPAAVRAVNDVVGAPQRVVTNAVGDFGKAVLGLPTLSTPGGSVAPQPAPQPIPPVQSPSLIPMTPASARLTEPAAPAAAATKTAAGPVALSATTPALHLAYDPIAVGLRMQERYAAGQRDAVLAAADAAAASGNPLNATARYMAALHALPTLSGQNNFGANEGTYAAERLGINQRERQAELNSATEQYKADTLASAERDVANTHAKATTESARIQAQALARNIQVHPIGEIVNPDPMTRVLVPKLTQYGTVTIDEATGKPVVTDMQGNVVGKKSGAAPVPAVGVKVNHPDGTYPLVGGKTATVKNGVITKLE